MDEKTEILIRQLADKLGTTTEFLWEVLLRQAFYDSLSQSIVLIVSFFALSAFTKILYKKSKEDDSVFSCIEDFILPFSIIFIAWLFLIITALFSVQDIITGFINPEYWALKEILKQF